MEIRKTFHLVLFLAVLARFTSLVFQLLFFEGGIVCPHTSECLLTRTAPELFFLSLYSVLILLYARLSSLLSGNSFFLLGPLFVAMNTSFYVGYTATAFVAYQDVDSFALRTNFLFGIFYVTVFCFLFAYGPLVTGQIMATGTLSSSRDQTRLPNNVIARFVGVLMMYSVIIIVRGFFFLGNAINFFGWQDGSPLDMDPYLFEVASLSFFELLPSCVALYIMRRRKHLSKERSLIFSGGISVNESSHLYYDSRH